MEASATAPGKLEPTTDGERVSICLCTRFAPAVGGIETLAEMFASQWTQMGHTVEVVTDVTGGEDESAWPFRVHRNPGPGEFLRVMRRSDALIHMNLSLKMLWPAIASRTKLIVSHQSWYCTRHQPDTRREQLKRWISRRWAVNISCSAAVRDALECGGEVVPNPYDHLRFRDLNLPRTQELVFVGRLVSDKGVDVLLKALARLGERGMRPALTVVGDGPERGALESLTATLGIASQVEFVGSQGHNALPAILNRHRVLVVPSRWDEPFGIVALEGAASGCVLVGSAGGGLSEAIGPCGLTFPNGDDAALASALVELLTDESRVARHRAAAAEHLARHRADATASRYLEIFREVVARK